jgi:iron complex outermembrane recepter protein
MAKILLIIIFIIFHQLSFSQISGKITDSVTGMPVPGANIAYGDGKVTASDPDGGFETEATGRLVISAIGYHTTTVIIIPGKSFYKVVLNRTQYLLEEVEVEAFNRSRRLVDVPGSLSMISPRQILTEQPVTIVPLLNQAPGVFAHSGALNTSRITIRGIGARVPYATGKVRAYFNNIPLTNGSGISMVEDLDPSAMERIEIIKGPATSAYGAGLGGTILITARKPGLHPHQVSNNFRAGSWDLLRNTFSIDTQTGNTGISLQYNHTQSNGYRQNNQYNRNGITAIARSVPGANTDITFLFVYTSLKAHIPSSIDSNTFVSRPRAAAANWLQTRGYEDYNKLLAGISAEHNFTPSFSANLSLFSTLFEEKEMRPFDVLNEDRFSGGTRLKLKWSGSIPNGNYQILGGSELFLRKFWIHILPEHWWIGRTGCDDQRQ